MSQEVDVLILRLQDAQGIASDLECISILGAFISDILYGTEEHVSMCFCPEILVAGNTSFVLQRSKKAGARDSGWRASRLNGQIMEPSRVDSMNHIEAAANTSQSHLLPPEHDNHSENLHQLWRSLRCSGGAERGLVRAQIDYVGWLDQKCSI